MFCKFIRRLYLVSYFQLLPLVLGKSFMPFISCFIKLGQSAVEHHSHYLAVHVQTKSASSFVCCCCFVDRFKSLGIECSDKWTQYKLKIFRCCTSLPEDFFSFRLIRVRSTDSWNALPPYVVDAPYLQALKSRLDSAWSERKFLHRLIYTHLCFDFSV